MKFLEFLKNNIVIFDGGMGTLLQKMGLRPGERPEYWNISHSDKIKDIHIEYFNAGSNVVTTNTFGANILSFSEEELDAIVKNAVKNARVKKRASALINKYGAENIKAPDEAVKEEIMNREANR